MNLPRFDHASVLTVGDLMLDRYWQGEAARISPEAPIPVVNVQQTEDRLGGAANVALNVAKLGSAAGLIGAVGHDESAQVITAKLVSAGINHDLVALDAYQTTTKFRIMSQKQQLVRADFEQTTALPANTFKPSLERMLNQYQVVILSDYDKGVLAKPQEFITTLRQQQKPVLIDPKFKDFANYQGATLIKPNQKEYQTAVGAWRSEQEMVQKCHTMISNLGFEAILVTCGSDGMTLVRKDQAGLHLPAHSHEVFDVSGAGDTVIAILAAALASGQSLVDAVQMANVAAGIVVTHMGTAHVSGVELRLALMDKLPFQRGILSQDQLVIAVDTARRRNETLVFTNGCFDILHAGHVNYLTQAKQLGDRLIVALNDDASVTRLKGVDRPINNLAQRLAVMAGLACVDWIVSFSEDTPEQLLRLLKPDVLVKGGDYDAHEVVGGNIVREYHGEVRVLNLVEGLSTTTIMQKLHRDSKPRD